MNWDICLICQQVLRTNKTVCPTDSKRLDIGIGYRTLTVAGFRELGQLPLHLNIELRDEGAGIAVTCEIHHVFLHVTCFTKHLHPCKLKRLKRKGESNIAAPVAQASSDMKLDPKVSRLTRTTTGSLDKQTGPVCGSDCFFSLRPGNDLRQVKTFCVDENVKHCASIIGDSFMQSKLANGDLIAHEAKYHSASLLMLYHKASCVQQHKVNANEPVVAELSAESLALAEVIAYIEDTTSNFSICFLSDLCKLYTDRLPHRNIHAKVNTTRFKERLLTNMPT